MTPGNPLWITINIDPQRRSQRHLPYIIARNTFSQLKTSFQKPAFESYTTIPSSRNTSIQLPGNTAVDPPRDNAKSCL